MRKLGFVLLFAISCAHAAPAATATVEPLRPRDLYPLRIGNQWTYDIKSEGQTAVRTVEVLSQDEDGYFVDNQKGRFKQDGRGLRDADRYLIETPVEKSHSWFSVLSMQSTERFIIPEDPRPCTVKAGTFGRCVTVQATVQIDADRSIILESTYAEGVGLVTLHTGQLVKGKPTDKTIDMELSSYHLAP